MKTSNNTRFPQEYIPKREFKPSRLIDVPSAWGGIESILSDILERFGIKGGSCLEFGVEFGYSIVALSNFFSKIKGVDTFVGDVHTAHYGDHFDATKDSLSHFSNIELFKSDYKDWITHDTTQYDLIHVDIVHTYEDTYACGLWSAQHSTCTIFHDTESFPEVRRAVTDIANITGKSLYFYPKFYGLGILVDRIPTYIYYHIAQMGNWKEVVAEQVEALKSSGLYDEANKVFVGIVGELPIDLPPKFEVLFHLPDISLAEIPTLEALRKHSLRENFNVLYFHTKGVSHLQQGGLKENVAAWRRYMGYFCIGHWRECLIYLEEFDAVGVDYGDKHFSGNFWWSKASYLRTLEHVVPPRSNAESWIGSSTEIKVKVLFRASGNRYHEVIKAETYTNY